MSIISAYIVPHPPLIIPEIGRGQELKVENTINAFDNIAKQIGEIKPDTIVIATPHSIMYSNYIHISPGKKAKGDFKEFGEPDVCFEAEYDTEFVEMLSDLSEKYEIPAGTLGEKKSRLDHGTMIPLHFINKYYTNYKIVRISISGLPFIDHYNFGKYIKDTAKNLNKKVVFIASGDLSHMLKDEGPYGFTEEGPMFDKGVTEAMAKGDFLHFLTLNEEFCEIAAECGLRSFLIMAGALDGMKVNSELLSYEGPYGVGYAVASFHLTGEDENRFFGKSFETIEEDRLKDIMSTEDDYVLLARKSLEYYVNHNEILTNPNNLPNEMINEKAGVFVSLKINGQLRGCIGTTSPTTNSVAEEIIQNAVSAGLEDPRFAPVMKNELRKLEYSVDVLKESELIESIHELNTKRYGVIVSSGRKKGLLLPNLEGINTPEEQVSIALKKAGISPNQKYSMERFEVIRHQ